MIRAERRSAYGPCRVEGSYGTRWGSQSEKTLAWRDIYPSSPHPRSAYAHPGIPNRRAYVPSSSTAFSSIVFILGILLAKAAIESGLLTK